MKLASVFGHNDTSRFLEPLNEFPLPKCKIGLEWEWENGTELRQKVAGLARNGYLSIHDDGSLRDQGVEIVTVGDGLYGRDLMEAIKIMAWTARECRILTPVCNYRTGFHVHLDIRDLEETELHNILILYCLLEKPIFNFVGKDRWRSNFCVPWFRSDAQFTMLKQIELAGQFSREVVNSIGNRIKTLQRYSALNCQAIAKLGTLEFRHMENHIDEIETKQVEFIKIIMKLKKAAIEFASRGKHGRILYEYCKEHTARDLMADMDFHLPTEGWDYPEALMSCIGLVNFDKPAKTTFADLDFDAFTGRHPNWR